VPQRYEKKWILMAVMLRKRLLWPPPSTQQLSAPTRSLARVKRAVRTQGQHLWSTLHCWEPQTEIHKRWRGKR
jgi:hypothetical protein